MDTFNIFHAHDVLEGLNPRHVELFWARIDKHVSYGDADYTLISCEYAHQLLMEAASELADEQGEHYAWSVDKEFTDSINKDTGSNFFAISG